MADINSGTFEAIVQELSNAFSPLAARFHHGNPMRVLSEFGLILPEGAVTPALESAFKNTHTIAHELPELTEALVTAINTKNIGQIIEKGLQLSKQIGSLIDLFEVIAGQIAALPTPKGFNVAEFNTFTTALPGRLSETIIVEYLESRSSLVFSIFELFGLLSQNRLNGSSPSPFKPEIIKKELHLDRISTFLSKPEQLAHDIYKWGDNNLDAELIINRLYQFFTALGIPVAKKIILDPTPRPALENFLFTITPTVNKTPPGIEIILMSGLGQGFQFGFNIADGLALSLSASGSASASASITIQPPSKMTFIPPSGELQGKFSLHIAKTPNNGQQRFVLLGAPGGSGISAGKISIGFVTIASWDTTTNRAKGDLGIEGAIENGKIHIDTNSADGFLGKILSGISLDSDFSAGLGWTAGGGFYFTGSAALQIQLPTHISFGPIELKALTLTIGINGNTFPIAFATDIKAELGPLKAVVEQIGAAALLELKPDFKGNLGLFEFSSISFKPPKGVGLSLEAAVVKGGGYLRFDPDREEYSGVLQLSFSGIVTITAIGLITTKMPDNSKGFSLLIIMSVEFTPGIQLGFGFTIVGLGGLIGLNRTMRLEALAQGVRTGTVNNIMFPKGDIIANAPRIISDLRAIFPPEEGKFLIGPMIKMGWGTPTLVTLSLGVIIEIPGNIAIIGVLSVILPDLKAPILVLQVTFVGAIEFDKKRLWFFASLFESRILFMTIEGEMGLLVGWGDDANFVVSVGGFHPRFTPPPLPFPTPRRIAVDMTISPVQRLRIEGYFAVTSNTVQFGAAAHLVLGLDDFGIEGHIQFDALFQFSPFHFIIEISASVSLKAFGVGVFSIRLEFQLEGPTPWRAHGKGSISILFFELSADFDITWGDDADTTLPSISIVQNLLDEFGKVDNWKAELPPSNNLSVTLRKMAEQKDVLVLHPLGYLRVSQRYIPLDLNIDKVGNQKPNDAKKFDLRVTSAGLMKKADSLEPFATAQFQNMDDATKLTKPAFEKQHAGLELTALGNPMRTSRMVRRVVRYEEIIIDNNYKRFVRQFTAFMGLLFNHFLGGSAVTKLGISQAYQAKANPFINDAIKVGQDKYAVAFNDTNKPFNTANIYFDSHALAAEYMKNAVVEKPNLTASLHVIPHFELAEV